MAERNEKGQFVKSNKAGKRGYEALIAKKFKGDKLAFKAYLSVIGKRGWNGLVSKQFGGNEEIAIEYVIALSKYAYGMCFYDKVKKEYLWWVKECFRQHPGTPAEFAQAYSRKLEFSLSDLSEQEF